MSGESHRAGRYFELGWGAAYHWDPRDPKPKPPRLPRRLLDQWKRGWQEGLESKRLFLEVRRQKDREWTNRMLRSDREWRRSQRG